MKKEQPQPTYQINLPAQVRFDPELSAHAKLLYGEIKALCDKEGYCWAGNYYFATVYQVHPKVVSRWVHNLCRQGYIKVEVCQGNQRKIFVEKALLKRGGDMPISVDGRYPKVEPGNQRVDALPVKVEGDQLNSKPEAHSLLIDNIIDYNDRVYSNNMSTKKWMVMNERMEEEQYQSEDICSSEIPIPPVAAAPPSPKQRSLQDTADKAFSSFIKPTLEQVEAYMLLQKELCTGLMQASSQAQRFFNYYESNGWRVGRNPMLDWQAAANNWLLNAQSYPTSKPSSYDRLHIRKDKDYSIPL